MHPFALDLLKKMNHPTAGLRIQELDEFAAAGAPHLDFVFTVCDAAASEVVPGLAGPADDRPLGRAGSCGGGRE